jgi:hypothetical protein
VVNPYNDVVVEESPVGSSNGILQLENNDAAVVKKYSYDTGTVNVASNVNFARSSRSLSAGTDDNGLNFVAYAKDGVDWTHFSTVNGAATNSDVGGNTAYSLLTPTEISEIYEGAITNWDQVGGKNAPIIVFSAQEGSGTQSTWKTYVQNNGGGSSTDPSKLSNLVNCFNTSGLTFNAAGGQTVPATQCAGPVDIFENETGSLNLSSLPASLTDPTTATSSGGFGAANAKITVTVTAATAPKSIPAPAACGQWYLGCTAAAVVKGASAGTYSQDYTLRSQTSVSVLKDAVFFYSTGLFNHQCVAAAGVNTKATCAAGNFVDYGVDSTGKTTFQLGELGGATPTPTATGFPGLTQAACPAFSNPAVTSNECLPTQRSVLSGAFASTRSVYNVYSNGTSVASPPIPAATPATLAYVSEDGFLCSPRTVTQNNPLDGKTYRADINADIQAAGFYPISAGASLGQINLSPLDENTVDHPAAAMTGVLTGPYGPYVTPVAESNGDPSGFCLVTTTDGTGLSGS